MIIQDSFRRDLGFMCDQIIGGGFGRRRPVVKLWQGVGVASAPKVRFEKHDSVRQMFLISLPGYLGPKNVSGIPLSDY